MAAVIGGSVILGCSVAFLFYLWHRSICMCRKLKDICLEVNYKKIRQLFCVFNATLREDYSYSPQPVDSILDAVLTVSPNKQYLGIRSPTTPATHGPDEK